MGLHAKVGSGIKKEIENELPELFKTELEVGKWYKYNDSEIHLVCFTYIKSRIGFGFGNSGWIDNTIWNTDNLRPAIREEVKQALIAEAEKRGFVDGATFDNSNLNHYDSGRGNVVQIKPGYPTYEPVDNTFWITSSEKSAYRRVIFKDGQWAEIVPSPKKMTISEIESKLGHKVEIVS